ncbi:hypothetical protein P175DRAFT_0483243 [Aspergillus ochraceoroseus IBT 24754]|uniref:AB hydrolase-1 domain-containing protein n=1 Tax=Aspergillus ochraceoroseus IBT 24754 TaxID=1392256 RepID=A0A2T5LTL1_9EURO|nr:uncharacterized protein P175DRAFT_0483243 [Aspergillus ochraceoroseus IBT 24754]PTU19624.1 hypothetical protein P175DRAFT_0483243 [Aspergillus ochraceoroseus IBT 24754]
MCDPKEENHPLSPGPHTFTSPTKNLTFEYIILHPPTHQPNRPPPPPPPPSSKDLIVIQCPAWGIGSRYLQTGLAPLLELDPEKGQKTPYTLLFFHPRGTDNSSRPRSSTEMSSMPHLASDLDDLREHLHLLRFPVLMGHSNGGAIVLGYAEMHPTRVSKLILLNHQLIGLRDRADDLQDKDLTQHPSPSTKKKTPNPKPTTDKSFTASVQSRWSLYFYNPAVYVPSLLAAIGTRIMPIWCYRSVYGCDENQELQHPQQMITGLERVRAKTLVISGRDDLICGLKIAERSKEGIPDSKMIVYDRCGHFPWIEREKRFFKDIREFLALRS